MTARQQAALRELGLCLDPDAPPSISAIVWACVHHAVHKTGGNAEHAAAWADRMATVADIAAGSPARGAQPEPHSPGLPW